MICLARNMQVQGCMCMVSPKLIGLEIFAGLHDLTPPLPALGVELGHFQDPMHHPHTSHVRATIRLRWPSSTPYEFGKQRQIACLAWQTCSDGATVCPMFRARQRQLYSVFIYQKTQSWQQILLLMRIQSWMTSACHINTF